MIKASELRIGNYLYDNEVGHKGSFKVSAGDILYIYKHGIETDYSTIPLTEEWLLKLGFFKPLNNIFLNNSGWIINYEQHSFRWQTTPLKYVHQLQNLYFALTSEELTIKQ